MYISYLTPYFSNSKIIFPFSPIKNFGPASLGMISSLHYSSVHSSNFFKRDSLKPFSLLLPLKRLEVFDLSYFSNSGSSVYICENAFRSVAFIPVTGNLSGCSNLCLYFASIFTNLSEVVFSS